jgi:2-(1,2-epoxy-1,2-dihydrophenyl)acetyl-CoA isomerase
LENKKYKLIATMNTEIIFEIKENIGCIIFNRPTVFNAFNRAMALQMQDALQQCAINKHIRCVYITGNGKAFCTGQDIGELTGPNAIEVSTILAEHFNPIVLAMRNLPKPIVAAVNGVAAGAGANIALCADVVVATAEASFIQAFSKIGLLPDSGGTFTLPRLIGFQKASALMMLADKISATEAVQMGMLYKVFTPENFAAESFAIATTLANMPTKGLALTKQALNLSLTNSFEQQLQVEDALQRQAAATIDYQEGITAFIEKRKPHFKGE